MRTRLLKTTTSFRTPRCRKIKETPSSAYIFLKMSEFLKYVKVNREDPSWGGGGKPGRYGDFTLGT